MLDDDAAAAGARLAAERVRRRPRQLGHRPGPALSSPGRPGPDGHLRRLGADRVRGAEPGRARRRAAPRASRAGPGLSGTEGGGGAGRPAGRGAAADQPGRLPSAPTSSTSSRGSTCWSASRRRRWTSSSRCSGSRTTSRPAGSGSIPRSIRCGTTRGSRSWSRDGLSSPPGVTLSEAKGPSWSRETPLNRGRGPRPRCPMPSMRRDHGESPEVGECPAGFATSRCAR